MYSRRLEQLDHVFHPLGRELGRQAIHLGNELQELAPAELFVQEGLVRHIAEKASSLFPSLPQIAAANADRPFTGKKQSADHFDGRGLTCPIGAEEGKQFSLLDPQAEIAHGRFVPIVLGNVFEFDHGSLGLGLGGRKFIGRRTKIQVSSQSRASC